MSQNDLQSHMTLLFHLAYYNKFDLNTLENLPIWELQLIRDLIITEEEKIKKTQSGIV